MRIFIENKTTAMTPNFQFITKKNKHTPIIDTAIGIAVRLNCSVKNDFVIFYSRDKI